MTSAPLVAEVEELRAKVRSLAESCSELMPMAILGAAYLASNGSGPDDTIQRLRRILLEIGDTQPQVAEMIETYLRDRGCPIDENSDEVTP